MQSTKVRTKVDKMFDKKNLTVLSDHYAKLVASDDPDASDSDLDDDESSSPPQPQQPPTTTDEDDFLTLKRADHSIEDINLPSAPPPSAAPSHRQVLKSKQKAIKERGLGKKLYFDEEGNALHAYKLESLDEFVEKEDIESRQQKYLDQQKGEMSVADVVDKTVAKEKLKEKKKAKKAKERASRQEVWFFLRGALLCCWY